MSLYVDGIVAAAGTTNASAIKIASAASGATNNYAGWIVAGLFRMDGSAALGGNAARATTAGTNRLDIFDGTAPVGTLANGISLYSTLGELRVMDAAGNPTLLSPHDRVTNEWIFLSRNARTGKWLRVDLERFFRWAQGRFGADLGAFVHEWAGAERDGWPVAEGLD